MNSVKSVTYGAMVVGLASIILLADRLLLGNLGFLFSLIIPIHLVVYGTKFSLKESVAVYFTMIVASFIFNGLLPAIISTVCFGLIGLIMIYTQKQRYAFLKRNLILFFSMSLAYFIMIRFFSVYFGVSIEDTITFIKEHAPQLAYNITIIFTYGSILVTILMEMYILNTASSLLQNRLFKGPNK